jgi:hypothetical protein
MAFTIKKGDTSPTLAATLIDPDGEPAPLSLASEVEFFLNTPRSDDKISADTSSGVSILNASDGRVSYSWSSGDTDIVGQREAEFVVTFNNGKVQSYPNDGYIYVIVEEDVETL